MNIRSWRGVTPLSETERKPFPWARVILIAAILAIGAYVAVPQMLYTSADGLVQGYLVPVAPLYRVRIDHLLVECSDHVAAGQQLAVVSNFLVQADYDRQYHQAMAQLQLSSVALDEGVAQAQTNASMLREKYVSSNQDAERLRATFRAYDEGYHGGAISKVDWEAKRNEWLSSQALARSDYQAWKLAEQQVHRIGVDDRARIAKDQQLATQANQLSQRVGHDVLAAPVGGYIVNCVQRPSNVVEAGNALFSIFQPERAYVLAYFTPSAVSKLALGETAQITVPGFKNTVNGRITAIYPNLSKLPNELTRYFRQHQQWSQYRPVRIALDSMPAAERAQLYYGAQVRIRVRNE